MTIHLSWWALPILWFIAALLIVVIRNIFDNEDGSVNILPLVIDLPVLAIGLFGAIGIVVGHFL